VNVLAEDDLLLHCDVWIKVHLKFTRARGAASEPHTHALTGQRLEIGCIAPQVSLLERGRMMKVHYQRRVDIIEKSIKAVANQHGRLPDYVGAFAPIEARKHEVRSVLGVLAKAQPALDQELVHREEYDSFVLRG